jgi:hypothetical protein
MADREPRRNTALVTAVLAVAFATSTACIPSCNIPLERGSPRSQPLPSTQQPPPQAPQEDGSGHPLPPPGQFPAGQDAPPNFLVQPMPLNQQAFTPHFELPAGELTPAAPTEHP